MKLLELLSLVGLLQLANATAITYLVKANEKACFYVWGETIGQKISFYFAVRT